MDVEAPPREKAHRKDLIEFASFHSRTSRRSHWHPNSKSALAALLAVAAVVFIVLRCEVWRAQGVQTLGNGERRLASGDEEEGLTTSIQESPNICEGFAGADEQQVQDAQVAALHSGRVPAAPASAEEAQARTSKRPGKTERTMELLFKMAKGSAQHSEISHSSRETSPSPNSSVSSIRPSEFEEPSTKKKKSEVSAMKETQIEEMETNAAGEPSPNSGDLAGEDDNKIPASLLEFYLQDTLHEAEESFLANWLLDSDEDIPLSPSPSGKEAIHLAAEENELEATASHEDDSLVVEQAAAIQAPQEKGVRTPTALTSTSSSEQSEQGAALPSPEASSPAEVRRLCRRPDLFIGLKKTPSLSRLEEDTARYRLTFA
ncbi:hypothetical protein Emag_006234 [Eimeria magna]